MLLKSFVRTGTLLAGARAFAPLSIQRRAVTKMSAAPIGVMVTVEIEEARVRSRRPAVLSRRLHESSPGDEVVAGFFFEFEAVRTDLTDMLRAGARLPRSVKSGRGR